MKKLILVLLIIKGVLLSSMVDSVEINGVKVPLIFEKDSSLPIVSMQVIFKNSGSLFDGDKYGQARFTASMLGEGTKSLGAVGFAKKLEDSAIHLSASSGNETFVFELSSLKEVFSRGVKLFDRLLKEPNFTQDSFDKIKILKNSFIKQKETDFDYIASHNLKKLLYADTPLAYNSIGTLESLKKMRVNDIQEYFYKHIVLNNAVIVIGGDLTLKEAKVYTKDTLSSLKEGKSESLKFYQASDKKEYKEVYQDTKQAYIYFGAPFNIGVKDENSYKARVATFILGAGGFGSRLMEEIRVKRGLAYSAYASLSLNLSNINIKGHLQTKIESKEEAIKLVKKVIKDFTTKGVTAEELDQAKKFLLGSEPLRNETLTARLSRAFMLNYKGFEPEYYKKELKKIEDLKLEDLNKFISSHNEINKLSFSIVTVKDGK